MRLKFFFKSSAAVKAQMSFSPFWSFLCSMSEKAMKSAKRGSRDLSVS